MVCSLLGSIAHVRDRFSDHTQQAFYAVTPLRVIGFWWALVILGALFFALTLVALRRTDTAQASA